MGRFWTFLDDIGLVWAFSGWYLVVEDRCGIFMVGNVLFGVIGGFSRALVVGSRSLWNFPW